MTDFKSTTEIVRHLTEGHVVRSEAATLLARLKADGGRYLLTIQLTEEERRGMLPPTYGSKGYTRWLTDEEHAALVSALETATE
jgi:hypothetical protein